MQILLSEQEYSKMKNDLDFYKNDHKKLLKQLTNDLQQVIQVTAHKDMLKREFEVINVEINVEKLVNVAIGYGFGEYEGQAIEEFLNRKRDKSKLEKILEKASKNKIGIHE